MKKFKGLLIGALVLVVALAVAGCGGSSSSSSSKTPPKPKTYVDADLNTMLNEAKENAAASNKKYKDKDKDIKIMNGTVNNINSDASYITLKAGQRFDMLQAQCYTHGNKELKDQVTNLKKGQNVTVYGHVKDVGEIMGYQVDIDKMEAK